MCLWRSISFTRKRWLAHPACVACANPALRSSTATGHACGLGWVLRTGEMPTDLATQKSLMCGEIEKAISGRVDAGLVQQPVQIAASATQPYSLGVMWSKSSALFTYSAYDTQLIHHEIQNAQAFSRKP